MTKGQRFWEWTGAAAIIASVIYTVVFLFQNNYLPFTFFYEPYDIYADWFNTAYWAFDKGTYDAWQTLYPPLSFVFLRGLSIPSCYPRVRPYGIDLSFGLAARDCDWLGLTSIWVIFLIAAILTYLCFRKIDKSTAIPRTIVVAFGWPMLNGVERGNLVTIAFVFFVLATGPLLKRAWQRWLCLALAINFKVYLLGAMVAPLLRRRWRWTEGVVISVVIVYLISFAILGRGSPAEIYANLQSWNDLGGGTPLDLWSMTTYEPLLKLARSDEFPLILIIGSRNLDLVVALIPVLLNMARGMILLAAFATWLRPEVVPHHRIFNFAVMMALITTEAGGYTSIYFMFLTLLEPWRGAGRKIAIVICYILAIAADIPIDEVAPVVRDTYVGGSTTIITFYVKLMPFIRPLLIQILAVAIACVTIRDVWMDIRKDGWGERWRFRHDAPLVPWLRRPTAPSIALKSNPAGQ